MAINKLWRFFGNRTGVAILAVQLILVLLFIYFYSGYNQAINALLATLEESA